MPKAQETTYRRRLAGADKALIQATVSRQAAEKLRAIARRDLTRTGPVIEKALAALEAAEALESAPGQ